MLSPPPLTPRFVRPSLLHLLLLALLALPAAAQARAQAAHPDSLRAEIAAADSIVFGAFNGHDMATLRTRFTRDLEFYHDQTGLTSYEDNMAAFAELFARDDGLHRERVPGTLEVYPMGEGGAIQAGEHRFCHDEGGREDCGTFPFVMIWRMEDGLWKIARVVSYGH